MVDHPPTPKMRLRGSKRPGGHRHNQNDHLHQRHLSNVHRQLEDDYVEYYRTRAGWLNDDEAMRKYNEGAYSAYYGGDSGAAEFQNGSGNNNSSKKFKAMDHLGWILGLASTFIFLVFLVKCASSKKSSSDSKRSSSGRNSSSKVKSRDSSRSIRDKHGERRRSRSRSRADGTSVRSSRSKSRTRTTSSSDYKLMDGDDSYDYDDTKSRRSRSAGRRSSSRSHSKDTRSRSRSRARSKSRSRASGRGGGDDDAEKENPKEQKMLV